MRDDSGAGGARRGCMRPIGRVRCAYVARPMSSGVSGAWEVAGTDGKSYVVKFNVPGDHTALNELACSCIAELFGLPLFEYALLEMDDAQAGLVNEQRVPHGLPEISAGTHFAVMMTNRFYSADSFEAAVVGVTWPDLSNAKQIPDMLGFDTLVQNVDRHCGNVCITGDDATRVYSIVIFDHSHAFGGPQWSPQSIAEAYQRMDPIPHFCLPVDEIDPHNGFDGFLSTVRSSLAQVLEDLKAGGIIPASWDGGKNGGIGHITSALGSLDTDLLMAAVRDRLQGGVAAL